MDDVRVHRNSPEPARLGALAYARGSDIHLGPGQDAHLPHEAWHVVQQKQGRVATAQMKDGVPVNDDAGLEREADVMGARAAIVEARTGQAVADGKALAQAPAPGSAPVQRRAPTTNDVPGTTKNGTTALFDSQVSEGPVFEKTVAVRNHDATTVIAAYQGAIAPIGNALAAATYTDAGNERFPNSVGGFPVHAPPNVLTYLTTVFHAPVGTVQFWFDAATPADLSSLFNDNLNWWSVKYKIDTWYNHRDGLLDNEYVGLVDPLIVRITFQSQQRNQRDWEVDTQFANASKGYIVRIHDGKNNITGSIVTAPVFAAAANPPAPVVAAPVVAAPVVAAPVVAAPVVAAPVVAAPVVAAPVVAPAVVAPLPPTPAANADDYVYSSTHVGGGPGNVAVGTRLGALRGFQNADTRVGQHDALDAFTLLAAEGARFRPVAELGTSARRDASFFTKPGARFQGSHKVTLHWLYVNWGTRFASAYDITKETMAGVVDAWGTAITSKPARPNYNLTTGVMER